MDTEALAAQLFSEAYADELLQHIQNVAQPLSSPGHPIDMAQIGPEVWNQWSWKAPVEAPKESAP